jgi:hypothetical protein
LHRRLCGLPSLSFFPLPPRRNQIVYAAQPRRDLGRHSGRHPERSIDLDGNVGKVAERYRRAVVLDLFAERIRQAGETANRHPDAEIVSLHVAGADVLRIRIAESYNSCCAGAHVRAVAFLAFSFP